MGLNLKEQAGPLPVGAWIAVVAGGLGVGFLGRRKRQQPTAQPTAQPIDSAPISGFRPAIQESSNAVPNAMTYKTNDEWAKGAINALIGHGYDPATATNAINFYLYPSSDHSTSAQEAAAIGAAILYVGSPPSLPSTFIKTIPSSITPVTAPTVTPGVAPQNYVWANLPGGNRGIWNRAWAAANGAFGTRDVSSSEVAQALKDYNGRIPGDLNKGALL